MGICHSCDNWARGSTRFISISSFIKDAPNRQYHDSPKYWD